MKIQIPTYVMEQEFANHHRFGYEAGYKAARDQSADELTAMRAQLDALLKAMTESLHLRASPPMKLLANAESFEAGRAMAFNDAKYSIGIDTTDGVHTVVVHRLIPNQPTVVVAMERLPSASKPPVFSGAICAKCKIDRTKQPCHTPGACGFVGVAQ